MTKDEDDQPTDAAVDRFIELKRQIGELEDELDKIKDDVFKVVDEAGGKSEYEGFTIRCNKKPKYEYSEEYQAKNDELKKLKKSEVEDGVATISGYSEYVTVRFKD